MSFLPRNFTEKENKQVKTNLRLNTSIPWISAMPSTNFLWLAVHFLPRGSESGPASASRISQHGWLHVGFLHGAFLVSLKVAVRGKISAASVRGSLLIYSLPFRKYLLPGHWAMNGENVILHSICCFGIGGLFLVPFLLESQSSSNEQLQLKYIDAHIG